jgi:hypothetical protein
MQKNHLAITEVLAVAEQFDMRSDVEVFYAGLKKTKKTGSTSLFTQTG